MLVNRGWVPTANKEAHTRLQGQLEGEVPVIGLLRPGDRDKV